MFYPPSPSSSVSTEDVAAYEVYNRQLTLPCVWEPSRLSSMKEWRKDVAMMKRVEREKMAWNHEADHARRMFAHRMSLQYKVIQDAISSACVEGEEPRAIHEWCVPAPESFYMGWDQQAKIKAADPVSGEIDSLFTVTGYGVKFNAAGKEVGWLLKMRKYGDRDNPPTLYDSGKQCKVYDYCRHGRPAGFCCARGAKLSHSSFSKPCHVRIVSSNALGTVCALIKDKHWSYLVSDAAPTAKLSAASAKEVEVAAALPHKCSIYRRKSIAKRPHAKRSAVVTTTGELFVVHAKDYTIPGDRIAPDASMA
eukprot:2275119-Prymnesium_polylepis.2